jgi:hypothetical protein
VTVNDLGGSEIEKEKGEQKLWLIAIMEYNSVLGTFP